MLEPITDKTTSAAAVGEQVVCVKCGAANPKEGRRCQKCRAYLYRKCPHCHARNERAAETCAACKRTMQTPPVKRLMHQLKSKRAKRFYRTVKLVASAIVILILIAFGLYFMKG